LHFEICQIYFSCQLENGSGPRQKAALQPIIAELNGAKGLSSVAKGDEQSELALDKIFETCWLMLLMAAVSLPR